MLLGHYFRVPIDGSDLQPTSRGRASAGAIGGAVNEQAGFFRARVGALLALTLLKRTPVDSVGLPVHGRIGTLLRAETDDPVDDLVLDLVSGGRIFVQAKLTADLQYKAGTGTDKAMRQFAAAVQDGLGPDDWLVLASARVVADLRAAGVFLERSRLAQPGGPVDAELGGMDRLTTIASRYLSAEQITTLFSRLVIWETDPTQGDGQAALFAGLGGFVVDAKHEAAAVRELTDLVRMIARRRAGLDGVGFAEQLAHSVPLRENPERLSTVAEAVALSRYRDMEHKNGTTLRLFGVPASIAALPMESADAQVRVIHDDAQTGDPLQPILRRLGRLLIVGEAGGGKSTALAAISAHWAERDTWPIPIRMHLRRLVDSNSGITETVLRCATEEAVGDDRAALRAVLERRLVSGEALLILDGVDEIGDSRLSVLSDLRRWLDNLHPGCGVLIATRPSTLADAKVLGLKEGRLEAPDYPRRTAEAIVHAAASAVGESRDEWVSARLAWLTQAFRRDRSLEQTPLTVVTLAVIAVEADDASDLPRSRSELLHRSLLNAVQRWNIEQRARGHPRLGVLEGARAKEGIRIALLRLCRTVIETPARSESDVRKSLEELVRSSFTLGAGDARSTAADAMEFWLSTGLFALMDGTLVSRSRPLAEAGAALSVTEEGVGEAGTWVTWARSDKARFDVLALASGLSSRVTEIWVNQFAEDGFADELVALADAVTDGAPITNTQLQRIVRRAVELLAVGHDSERLAEAIVALPLDAELRTELRPALLNAIEDGRRLVFEALIITSWDEVGPAADTVLRRLISSVEPEPEGPQRGEDGILHFGGSKIDGPYQDVYEAAVRRLVLLGRADAELVVEHRFSGRIEHYQAVLRSLETNGHADLVSKFEIRSLRELRERGGFFDQFDFQAATLRVLSEVERFAEPKRLSPEETHQMDELASFFETAGVGSLPPQALLDMEGVLPRWLRAAATLGGFDLDVLSGEASELKTEIVNGLEDDLFIYKLGVERELVHWGRAVDVSEAIKAIAESVGRIRGREGMISQALATCPRKECALPILEARLKRVTLRRRETVAWAIILCSPDPDLVAQRFYRFDDPWCRSAAALWWSVTASHKRAFSEQLMRCLEDRDENVRDAALTGLTRDELTDPMLDELVRVETGARCPWECGRCGSENQAGLRACPKCDTGGPDSRAEARKLLGRDRGSLEELRLRLPRTQRRVRRHSGPPA